MSSSSALPPELELERHIDESLLQNINSSTSTSPTVSRAQPGALLLSPNAKAQATPSELLSPEPLPNIGPPDLISPTTLNSNPNLALLSPPGSRYNFELSENNPVSPLLSSNNNPLIGTFNNTSLQRPLSAQSFHINGSNNNNNNNNDAFDAFRPFSTDGIGSNTSGLNYPERPLSSMEIDSITFKNDVGNFIDWVNTLNSNQQKVVADNLIEHLPVDVVNYLKIKLEYYNYSDVQRQLHFNQSNIQEPTTLDSILNGNTLQASPLEAPVAVNLQRALSPNFPSYDRNQLLQDVSFNRPRSADPYSKFLRNNEIDETIQKQQPKNQIRYEDENSQTSFDITNLAQQLTQSSINVESYNSNSLKLSALSTINNRAQLDSGKIKRQSQQHEERGRTPVGYYQPHGFTNSEEYHKGSSSLPPVQRVNYYETLSKSPNRPLNKQRSNRSTNNNNPNSTINQGDQLSRLASLNSAVKNLSLDQYHQQHQQQQNQQQQNQQQQHQQQQHQHQQHQQYQQQHQHQHYQQQQHQQQQSQSLSPDKINLSNISINQQSSPKTPAINAKQITSLKLLNDVPAWLKSLRLHKYTSALKDIPWKELIYLDDGQLESLGVSAMGARGKLLKAFEVVKQSYETGSIRE